MITSFSQLIRTKRLLALTAFVLSTAASQALVFHVTIDTAALNLPANSGSKPFALDFQLNSGNTLNNNTAVISNFTFGGGGAPFGTTNLFGGATGTLASSITLTDTSAFNEFFQSFTAGGTIGFDVSLTQNVDAGATPDAFVVALLDKNLFNVPTTGLGDSLVLVNITGATTKVQTFSGTGSFSQLAASTPDTGSSFVLLGFAVLGLTVLSFGAAAVRRA